MKTLDETIAELEDEGLFADALHYLKEYRAELAQNSGELGNDPLTWSELQQMEGKPVWIEGEHGCIWDQKSWVLIRLDKENDDLIICVGTDNGHYAFAIGKEDYGTDWQAYRKERR